MANGIEKLIDPVWFSALYVREAGAALVEENRQRAERLARDLERVRAHGQDFLGMMLGQSRPRAEQLIDYDDRVTKATDSRFQQLEERLPEVKIDPVEDEVIDLNVLESQVIDLRSEEDRGPNWYHLAAVTATWLKQPPSNLPAEEVERTIANASIVLSRMPIPVVAIGLEAEDTALLEGLIDRVNA